MGRATKIRGNTPLASAAAPGLLAGPRLPPRDGAPHAFKPNDPPPPSGKPPAAPASGPKPVAPSPSKPELPSKPVPKPAPANVNALRPEPSAKRLVSLDAYRGFIMTLLAASGFGIAELARQSPDSPLWKMLDRETWQHIGFHFNHPAWRSNFPFGESVDPLGGSPWLRGAVSLWDLIQPAFMFMVGVAMAYSARKRTPRVSRGGSNGCMH